MRLALATCSNLPDWEVDDLPFHQAIVDAGIDMERPIWDDPAVDWKSFDLVLIRTTWDYQEKQQDFNAWAERISVETRLVNPVNVVVWNTAKTYLRDLERVGAPLTPTKWLDQGTQVDIQAMMQGLGWTRGFLKPVVGATARETLPFDCSPESLEKAQAHLDRLLPVESMMLQPFLASVMEEGEYSAIFFGGEFSHGVQKIPVAGDYRVQDDFGATDKPHTFSASDYETVQQIEKSLLRLVKERFDGVTLTYARVDMIRDAEGKLRLNELELVEPSLFFRHDSESPKRFVNVLTKFKK